MMSTNKSSWVLIYTYVLVLFLFMNQNSMMTLWILMELNMISFILIISSNQENWEVISEKSFFYFIIQSLGSLTFLTSISLCSSFENLSSDFMFIFSLVLKMGIWPLHFWIFEILKKMNYVKATILLVLQKIPLLLIISIYQNSLTFIILLMSMIMGSLMIVSSVNFKDMLISSSIYFTFWFWMFTQVSCQFMMIFLISYFTLNILGFKLLEESSMNLEKMKIMSMSMNIILIIMMIGLPPFSMFYMKIYIITKIVENMSYLFLLMVSIGGMISTLGYMKNFLSSMNSLLPHFKLKHYSLSYLKILIILQIYMLIIISF